MVDPEGLFREVQSSLPLVQVVHYGCESWYNVKDRPVAVSCVSFYDFVAHRETAFSLTDQKDDPEVSLLRRYFDHLRARPDAYLVHWNMTSAEFGFQPIENRYRFLTGKEPPYSPPAGRLFDLDDYLGKRHGACYVDHPKLYNLAALNSFNKRFSLSGKEEADKFDRAEYGDIKRSTTEKARMIAYLLERTLAGTLVTKTSGPLVPFAGSILDAPRIVLELGARFRDVARQLKRRHKKRTTLEVNDEYDFQDLFHSMLRVFFPDVREEEWAPSYAGASSRIDFLLPEYALAVELKHGRDTMTAKTLGEELVVDVKKYGTHPGVRHLICIVFDPEGHVHNPRGLEKDLSTVHGGLLVHVRVIDR